MTTYLVIQSFSALTATYDCKEANRYYPTGVHLDVDMVDCYEGRCNLANEDLILYGVPLKSVRRIKKDANI